MTIKISQLGTLTALAGNTLIPVVESTSTGFSSKKIQASALRSFFANLATGGDSANLRINSDLIPSASGTYDLGSASSPYAAFYLTGTLTSSGVIQNTSNIQSQSTTTGALLVQGGVGVTGNINAQNIAAISLTGTLTTPNQPNITGVGVITSGTWQGMSITNAYLANSGLTINGTSVSLGGTATITANAATLTGIALNSTVVGSSLTSVGNLTSLNASGNISTTGNVVAAKFYGDGSSLTGVVGIGTLGSLSVTGNITAGGFNGAHYGSGAGLTSIPNGALTNSSLTVNGTAISLGGSATVTANAQTLTGTALNSTVVNSSLTSVGNIASGTWSATPIQNAYLANNSLTINGTGVSLGGTATVTANAQTLTGTVLNNTVVSSSLTSVGNLTSLSARGAITTTGNVSAAYFIGDGSQLTNVPASALIGTASSIAVSGNITAGNVSAAKLTGTLTTASQTNITAVGNIVTGTWSATPIQNAYLANNSLTINGTGVSLGGTATVTANAQTLTGTVLNSTVVASSLTSVGNLTALSASGNISTTGNIIATKFYGDGSSLTGVVATGIGNLTSITVGNITNANANGVGNIGSSTNSFNTIFARATSAQYADIAECYLADAAYTPGTVLEFGGKFEVTESTDESQRIAGVVSTNPAYVMNDQLQGQHVVQVALLGRVPCRVRGKIFKGDFMVAGGSGYARPTAYPKFGTVIGKALEDFDGVDGIIEIVVGRL
jgi:Chlorovirus glycoprotein repeat